jgi:hypothetical protein
MYEAQGGGEGKKTDRCDYKVPGVYSDSMKVHFRIAFRNIFSGGDFPK